MSNKGGYAIACAILVVGLLFLYAPRATDKVNAEKAPVEANIEKSRRPPAPRASVPVISSPYNIPAAFRGLWGQKVKFKCDRSDDYGPLSIQTRYMQVYEREGRPEQISYEYYKEKDLHVVTIHFVTKDYEGEDWRFSERWELGPDQRLIRQDLEYADKEIWYRCP